MTGALPVDDCIYRYRLERVRTDKKIIHLARNYGNSVKPNQTRPRSGQSWTKPKNWPYEHHYCNSQTHTSSLFTDISMQKEFLVKISGRENKYKWNVSFGGHPQDGHLCLGTPWSQVSSFNWFWDALWLVPGPRKTVLRFPGGAEEHPKTKQEKLTWVQRKCRNSTGSGGCFLGWSRGGFGVTFI